MKISTGRFRYFSTKIDEVADSVNHTEQNPKIEDDMGTFPSKNPDYSPKNHKIGIDWGSISRRKKVGDRVALLSSKYGIGPNRPIWGSEQYGYITGSVRKVDPDSDHVVVVWSNGRIFSLKHGDIALIKEDKLGNDPNYTFSRRKRPPSFANRVKPLPKLR